MNPERLLTRRTIRVRAPPQKKGKSHRLWSARPRDEIRTHEAERKAPSSIPG